MKRTLTLALLLLWGLCAQAQTEADCTDSIALWRQGMQHHDGRCAARLSRSYHEGNCVEQDLAMAEWLLLQAVEWGYTPAYGYLCWFYYNQGDYKKMEQTARQGIAAGNTECYLDWAMLYRATGKEKKCISLLQKGIANGCLTCRDQLAEIYRDEEDYKSLYALYERQNDAEGWYHMAYIILLGQKPKGTMEQALTLLNKSADAGHLPALTLLGVIYTQEELGIKNDNIAIGYLQRLADQGDPSGYYLIANIYRDHLDGDRYVEYLRKAADQDFGPAWSLLGIVYDEGLFLPADKARALDCYSKASLLGTGSSTYRLALCHLNGDGVERDAQQGTQLMGLAARQGFGKACAWMGKAFEKGIPPLSADMDSAWHYYQLGSQEDDPDCDYRIGLMRYQQGKYKTALSFLRSAASNDHKGAQLLMAQCLLSGAGMEADPTRAFALISRLAHEYTLADAYALLGRCYVSGTGCPQNPRLGKACQDTAVALGSIDALYRLGCCYYSAVGCQQDTALALTYIRRAADSVHIEAITFLGDYYAEAGNYKEAVAWYEKGVALGYLEPMCALGECYRDGNGVVLNSKKAYDLFLEAANAGSARGMMLLAQCYLDGIHVESDVDEGMTWLGRAVQEGYAPALYYAGFIYENGASDDKGHRVKPDLKTARQCYEAAALMGNQAAKNALERMQK